MKKIILSLVTALMVVSLIAVPVFAATTVVETADLITDGGDTCLDVGDLEVVYDDVAGTITVNFISIDSPWVIEETHVYISGTEAPKKSSPGRFPYADGVASGDLDLLEGQEVYIAAHAEISQWMPEVTNPDGTITPGYYIYESVWAQTAQTGGTDVAIGKGANWATNFIVIPIPEV